MQGVRYAAVSLALGFVAVWASENMFWIVPPDDLGPVGLLLTWLAYALCAACALSMVLWSGVAGWPALFLGGAVLGYLVEGVVVGTIYDAFPLQLVWTPLAWHALLSGGLVLGLGLAPLSGRARALGWLGAGALWTLWALYWPVERAVLPGQGELLVYLVLPALGVAVAFWLIGVLGRPAPAAWVLWVAPGLVAALAVVQGLGAPDPRRLVLPLLIGLIWWIMRRRGRRGGGHGSGHGGGGGGGGRSGGWVASQPLWHGALVMLAPLCVALLAPPLWARFGAVAVNVPFAIGSGIAGLALLVALGLRR
ncbi:MAG: hypothetical protein GW886_13290 [Rhodobacterales bacterium]|nr:hypothetical protein [Rhodobacterales bacterium]NCT12569.1 hypothetical protein [Rhodobacterales bacterium]